MVKKRKELPKKKSLPKKSGKSAILWICLAFFACGWMFVLGVLVGRGTAPVKFDIEKLQKELAALKEAVLKKELRRYKIDSNDKDNKTKLNFYSTLKESTGEKKLIQDIIKKQKKKASKNNVVKVEKKIVSSNIHPDKKKNDTGETKTMPPDKMLTIQVASLKDFKIADKMVALLRKKGYPAYSAVVDLGIKGTWHRVRVGGFKDKGQALTTMNRLKKDHYQCIVVKR